MVPVKKAIPLLKNINTACIAIVVVFFYAVVCYAQTRSVDAPIFHLDGAFQTASGLFRLWHGELPGRDFYPYLGIGPIALMFPPFLLMGSNLAASVFASYLAIYAANVFCFAVLIHLIWKSQRFLLSLAVACGAWAVIQLLMLDSSPWVGKWPIPEWLAVMTGPGNSLRPLRGVIPYMAAAALYFFVLPAFHQRRKEIAYALTLAVISLWSNDYAIITLAATVVVAGFVFVAESNKPFFEKTCRFIVLTLGSVALTNIVVTGFHPLKLLSYNFLDVAKDQWWYFGYWLENTKVMTPQDIKKIFIDMRDYFSLYVLGINFIAVLIFKNLRKELFLVWLIGMLMLGGGMVACVGGHIITYYFDGFKLWGNVTAILLGTRAAYAVLWRVLPQWVPGILRSAFLVCSFYVAVSAAYYAHIQTVSFTASRANNDAFLYVPELGAYLTRDWAPYIDYIRAHNNETVIEEYFGIWSAMVKKPSIWPVDSAIHALGSVRKIAADAVKHKADIVVTSNRQIANEWLGWNVSANYWLYETLLKNYTPDFNSPTTIVWKKAESVSVGKNVPCEINTAKNGVVLNKANPGYYEVQLSTDIQPLKKNKYIVMFDNNINYSMLEVGVVAIDPSQKNHTVPVYVPEKGRHEFMFSVRPVGTVAVTVTSCTANTIEFENEQVLPMSEGVDAMYDNRNNAGNIYGNPAFWDRGVSTTTAGFLVYRTMPAYQRYQIGNTVVLPGGDKRQITSLGGGIMYLEVYVSGDILQPEQVGLPNRFTVLTREQSK